MKIYINSTGNISPQKTFNGEFLDEIIEHEQTDHLNCVEPIYKDYINPMAARRMSKIIKNGYCAAKICLQEAAIDNPELPIDFVVQVLGSMKEPRSDATPFLPRSGA